VVDQHTGYNSVTKPGGRTRAGAHLQLRKEQSRPLFARLLRRGHRHRSAFEPRSRMGRAIRYLLRHFRGHGCFLRHASIPPDNNIAEASLRRVALGRSNFLFVGHKDAGDNLAVLYTLVASCEKHSVNPIAYLTDMLLRVQRHPAAKVRDLLLDRWSRPTSRPRDRPARPRPDGYCV
jgi:transposase